MYDFNFSGKRVFITGGAQGIGLETVKRFYQSGADIVVIDRPSLKEVEFENHFPERMTYIQGDITVKETLEKIQLEIQRGIDVLINNAGITRDASLLKLSEDDFDLVINVNLKAVFQISKMALSKMKESKNQGTVINTASVVAHYGNFGQTNYVASKAAVIGMTKTWAKEFGKDGIRVNAVAPGFIRTPMVDKMPEKIIQMMEEKCPMKRMGKPEEIANAYIFLASPFASYVNGTVLNVDGGMIIG